jgi:carbonic anhydrase
MRVMCKLQNLIGTLGFAAAVLTAGSALGGADHGHGGHEDAAPAAVAPATQPAPAHGAPATSVSADDAIKMLADGNARFVAGAPARPHQDQARLCETFTGGQHPYAAVLACADSRVPVEFIFDAGIGDLFVTRVAGNVADVDETGTIEYGVEHLGINAIVVMGHAKCGAVTAVVEGAHVTKNIELLVDNIAPAAEQARKAFPQLTGARLVDKAIRANVNRAVADLMKSDVIRTRVEAGTLKIVGGVYSLHTGEVDWLEPATASVIATSNEEKPAAKPSAHDAHSTAKPEASHDAKHHDEGDEHADAKHAAPTTAPVATAGMSKDNLPLLGGMLAVGGAVSWGVTHLIRARGGNHATVEPATPVATPAPAPAPAAS